MRAGDFVGVKVYRKPAEDKRTKKDGTPRSPKKLGKIHFPVFTPGGTRVVGDKVKKGAKVLDDKGSVAVDKGSRALGKQLGKTRGMFKAFKDEYQKASGSSSKASK